MDMAKIEADLKRVPWWGYAAGGGVVLGVGYFIVKHKAAPASSAASSQVNATPLPAGLNMADLAGMPFDYQDYDAEYTGDPNSSPDTDPNPPSSPPTTPPGPLGPGGPAQPYPPAPSPAPAPNPPPDIDVKVEPWPAWDSTLSGIGGHYGMSWQALYGYDNNKATIDELAHEHGHYGDEYNWLFPGEIVHVPAHGS